MKVKAILIFVFFSYLSFGQSPQKFTYQSIIKNSKKRKKTVFLSQNINEYNRVSGSFGGSGSPPRNKF